MKAVFLDRDNTLIENDDDLGRPEDVKLRRGVGGALRSLQDEGYRLIVVTNQGGVARGQYTEQDVDSVHQRIAELIDEEAGAKGIIDRFYYCPYHPEGSVPEYARDHPWRKPQPGMLVQAARDLDLSLNDCWMIGDQPRDIEAGESAGCRTILLGESESAGDDSISPSLCVHTIAEAAEAIIQSGPPGIQDRDVTSGALAAAGAPARAILPEAAAGGVSTGDFEPLRRALHEVTEEMRSERLRRTEFTPLRMAAGLVQLMVLLLGLLALLQAGNFEAFMQWLGAAVLLQLVAITFVVLDLRS